MKHHQEYHFVPEVALKYPFIVYTQAASGFLLSLPQEEKTYFQPVLWILVV
jgi:hypothetical protein